jgi:hypothetical protein
MTTMIDDLKRQNQDLAAQNKTALTKTSDFEKQIEAMKQEQVREAEFKNFQLSKDKEIAEASKCV